MKPFWQLNLNIAAVDGFMYMGNLFVILPDNTVRYIDLDTLAEKYFSQLDNNTSFIKDVFFYNHLADRRFKTDTKWKTLWDSLTTRDISIELNTNDLPLLCELNTIALDLKIYGQKLIAATRSGVFEAPIDFTSSNPILKRALQRVFDSKATYLSAKAGEVFISCVDGLFRGSYWNANNILDVSEHPIESFSQRTNWRLYDLVNFREPTKFHFYLNKIENADPKEFPFLQDDGENHTKKIRDFGIHQFESTDLFKTEVSNDDILFSFNSNKYIFIVTVDGDLQYLSFSYEDYLKENLRVEDIRTLTKFDLDELGKPLSAHTVPLGTVFEFFDKVMLVKRGQFAIESEPVNAIRTYPNSKWYKNIVVAFKKESLTLTALNPFT